MAFQIPTLDDLVQRTARAFRLNLKGSDAWLYPNNVADSSKVIAGAVWAPFSFLAYIQRQAFAHLADAQFLDSHGREYGMPRLAATYAAGIARLSGVNGTVVPAGLELKHGDGLRYTTTTGGDVIGGVIDVGVTSQTVGRTGNAAPNAALSFTSIFAGLETAAIVAAQGVGGGADIEGDEAYRSRILFRKRMPPRGGAAHDYVAWAREVNGVTRVFVDPVTLSNGRSDVGVYFLMDDAYDHGIPLPADVAIVAAHIDSVRPAGARVTVLAPSPVPVDITIANLSPDTSSVRSAIYAELIDLFRRESRVSTLTNPASVFRSKLWEAISTATGENHHEIASPTVDAPLALGQVATLGVLTFV